MSRAITAKQQAARRDVVSEARALCDEIAGALEDGMGNEEYRGSIEIVGILMDEIYRLRSIVAPKTDAAGVV